jgi:hypothetical protein
VADRFNLRARRHSWKWWVFGAIAGLAVLLVAAAAFLRDQPRTGRILRLRQYWADPEAHLAWTVRAGERCAGAPFIMPTDGYIGFFWHDSFQLGKVHQGLDIFGPTGPDGLGQTPVVAVYAGNLTRLADWHSAVILRVPHDPLQPERQIWIYYAHMADAQGHSFILPAYPPGTQDRYVEAGALLGYQGDYSGDPNNPVGMHLHFSIVQDDGQGGFKNELDVSNTLDPSPYLGLELDARNIGDEVAVCPNSGR